MVNEQVLFLVLNQRPRGVVCRYSQWKMLMGFSCAPKCFLLSFYLSLNLARVLVQPRVGLGQSFSYPFTFFSGFLFHILLFIITLHVSFAKKVLSPQLNQLMCWPILTAASLGTWNTETIIVCEVWVWQRTSNYTYINFLNRPFSEINMKPSCYVF